LAPARTRAKRAPAAGAAAAEGRALDFVKEIRHVPAREPSEIERWAETVALEHLQPLGDRWLHTLGVVEQARGLSGALPSDEAGVLAAAAFLYDIGYAPSLVVTGFHPLDGAAYVAHNGHPRLAALVAHHAVARHEAALRGLSEQLDRFPREWSAVADASISAICRRDRRGGSAGRCPSVCETSPPDTRTIPRS
jgi:hypothetical protein